MLKILQVKSDLLFHDLINQDNINIIEWIEERNWIKMEVIPPGNLTYNVKKIPGGFSFEGLH